MKIPTIKCHTCGDKLSAREETEWQEANTFSPVMPLCDDCYANEDHREHGEAEPTWDSDSGL